MDVNIQSKWGYSILTESMCNTPDLTLTKYVLQRKADPNLRTLFGTTPLISASNYCVNMALIHVLPTALMDCRH